MGVAQSTPYLSDDITLNRIRSVCQAGDKTMDAIKRPNIELLANDLATLGFPIKLKDSHGNPYSSDHLCNIIRLTAVPNVERVCMMSGESGAKLDQLIDQTVNHFRKNYGAEISVNETYRGKSRRRNSKQICDDLYYVSDKLNRKLTDRPQYVKAQLQEGIEKLKKQKERLDSEFRGAILDLKVSQDQDKLDDRINKVKRVHELASYETEKQLDKAVQELNNLISTLDDGQLNEIKQQIFTITEQMGPSSGSDLKQQVQGLLDILPKLTAMHYGANKPVMDFYEKNSDLSDASYTENLIAQYGAEEVNRQRMKALQRGVQGKLKTGSVVTPADAAKLIAETAAAHQNGGMGPDVGNLNIDNIRQNFSYF